MTARQTVDLQDFINPRPLSRQQLSVLVFCGFTMGGLSAAAVIADFGWQGVLILGGALMPVLALVFLFTVPESVRGLVPEGGHDGRVGAILRRIAPEAPLDGAQFVGVRRVAGSPVRQLFASGLLMDRLNPQAVLLPLSKVFAIAAALAAISRGHACQPPFPGTT